MHKTFTLICLAATLALAATALATTAMAAPKFRGNPDDVDAELDHKFTLRFYDAVTGRPIAGAKVTFEGKSGTTDSSGGVRFTFPDDLRPGEEKRWGSFSRGGYVNAKVPILFQVGTLFFNRFSVSPMIPIGYVRVVVDWSKKPADLDAHMEKVGAYHISFRNTKNYKERAWLDRDDTDGFGPETITVKKIDSKANYRFFLHNWTDKANMSSTSLSDSRAQVRVYTRKGLKQSFSVPANSAGTFWHVFDIRAGAIVPVERIVKSISGSAGAPASASSGSGRAAPEAGTSARRGRRGRGERAPEREEDPRYRNGRSSSRGAR